MRFDKGNAKRYGALGGNAPKEDYHYLIFQVSALEFVSFRYWYYDVPVDSSGHYEKILSDELWKIPALPVEDLSFGQYRVFCREHYVTRMFTNLKKIVKYFSAN